MATNRPVVAERVAPKARAVGAGAMGLNTSSVKRLVAAASGDTVLEPTTSNS